LHSPGSAGPANLTELWQQILASLELPSTRMLLSQQARLIRLDERRAVVQVAGNWMAMVQSRQSLVEQAIARALGTPRQLVLEAGGEPPVNASPPLHQPSPHRAASAPPSAASPPAPAPPGAPMPPGAQDSPAPNPAAPSPIDDQARRLAEFFNGEVVDVEGPIEGLGLEAA
jgi:DNA polymerase-3 subunit gamma/tau